MFSGAFSGLPVSSAPNVRISCAARARDTPNSRSTSRRVSRSRSRVSSCRMASGMARSHRGVAGIGERRVGYNPCGACEVGRWMAGTAVLYVSRPIVYWLRIRSGGRGGAGVGSHKAGYGTVRTGDGPNAGTRASPGAAAHTTGGRSPAPSRATPRPTQ